MAHYFIGYHGGEQPETPEEGKALMQKWMGWVGGLGKAMINPGTPLGNSHTVSAQGTDEGGGVNPLMGYSIVEAEDLDAALEIARSCPHLLMKNATLEVAELKQMPTG